MAELVRLNKYISESGLCSRREADKYIENGNVLIEKGSPIRVSITQEKAKVAGKEGEISINAVSTVAKDGKTINLYGNHTAKGNNRLGLALGLGIGLGCTFLLFIGFAFIAIKGKEAKI